MRVVFDIEHLLARFAEGYPPRSELPIPGSQTQYEGQEEDGQEHKLLECHLSQRELQNKGAWVDAVVIPQDERAKAEVPADLIEHARYGVQVSGTGRAEAQALLATRRKLEAQCRSN